MISSWGRRLNCNPPAQRRGGFSGGASRWKRGRGDPYARPERMPPHTPQLKPKERTTKGEGDIEKGKAPQKGTPPGVGKTFGFDFPLPTFHFLMSPQRFLLKLMGMGCHPHPPISNRAHTPTGEGFIGHLQGEHTIRPHARVCFFCYTPSKEKKTHTPPLPPAPHVGVAAALA